MINIKELAVKIKEQEYNEEQLEAKLCQDIILYLISKSRFKYNNKSITQYYFDLNILNIGKTNFNYNGSIIPIYNKERLLIELIRYKNKLPYDYYKEIINYYRKNLEQIDMSLVLDYLSAFPKENKILRTIQTEVI